MHHKFKWTIPEKLTAMVPQHKRIVFIGTTTKQSGILDQKAKESEAALEKRSRVN